MSCADLALVPFGGRRKIKSAFLYFRRYVQFDAPPEYCVTSTGPDISEPCSISQLPTARTSSSSPARTAPPRSIVDIFIP